METCATVTIETPNGPCRINESEFLANPGVYKLVGETTAEAMARQEQATPVSSDEVAKPAEYTRAAKSKR